MISTSTQRRESNRRARNVIRELRENEAVNAEFREAIQAGETLEEKARVFVAAWNAARAKGARFFDERSRELRTADLTIQAMIAGEPITILSPKGVPTPVRRCSDHDWASDRYASAVESPDHPAARSGLVAWEECRGHGCDAWRPIQDKPALGV